MYTVHICWEYVITGLFEFKCFFFQTGQRSEILRQEEERGHEGAEDHRVAVRSHEVGREENKTG